MIGQIADKVGEFNWFQRRPVWKRAAEQQPDLRDGDGRHPRALRRIFRGLQLTSGLASSTSRTGAASTRPRAEERLALWDKLYDEPGFGIWLSNFREIFTTRRPTPPFRDSVDRIRRRVKDPVTAEKLDSENDGFGVQRVPLETNYFEAYNRDNVHLVDISETPLERVTETGLRTTARDYELDILVYSTASMLSPAIDAIDITGVGGVKLADQWRDGPSTFLGMMAHGFPNLLMPPGRRAVRPRRIFRAASRTASAGAWACSSTSGAVATRRRTDGRSAGALDRACDEDVRHHADAQSQSWFTGYNSNIPGHEHGKTRYLVYNGGTPKSSPPSPTSRRRAMRASCSMRTRGLCEVRDRRRVRRAEGRGALAPFSASVAGAWDERRRHIPLTADGSSSRSARGRAPAIGSPLRQARRAPCSRVAAPSRRNIAA